MKVITTHPGADFDALASMVAASLLHPDAYLVFSGSQELPVRRFLGCGIYQLPRVIRLKELTMGRISHLILVDTRQRHRIGPFAELIKGQDVADGPTLEIFDHHPSSGDDLAGDFETVDQLGATTTLMVERLRQEGINIPPLEATLFTLGIYQDTGRLSSPNTTERDLLAAAHLLAQGADLQLLNRFLLPEFSSLHIELLNDLIQAAEVYHIGGLPVVISAVYKDRYIGELALVVHRFVEIERLSACFVLVMMEDRLFMVGRSHTEALDVGEVIQHFGGGGHASAAAASVKDTTLVQARERLVRILGQNVRPLNTASRIMNPTVQRVSSRERVSAVKEILQRWRVNALPVGTGKRVIGSVTRQAVDGAITHGLGDRPLREIMGPAPPVLAPETGLEMVHREMVGRNFRFVLVGRSLESVEGIITRMDLFRHAYRVEEEGELAKPAAGERPRRPTREDVRGMLSKRLRPELHQRLLDLGQLGKEMGLSVYLVGGLVRDLLLGLQTRDIDLVVEGDGVRFAQRAAARMGAGLRIHRAFATATLRLDDGTKIDVATARTEHYPGPGSLPEVERALLRRDLYRRDFTINSLAVAICGRRFGELVDYFSGLRDLRQGVIRVIHSLSFIEDPTRAIRASRFSGRLDFSIGRVTGKMIGIALRNNVFDQVSGGRLLGELVNLCGEEHASRCFERMADFGLIRATVHPGITWGKPLRDLVGRVEGVLNWHRLLYRPQSPQRWMVFMMALCYRIDREARLTVCRRFGLSGRERQVLLDYKIHCSRVEGQLLADRGGAEPRPSQVWMILEGLSLESILFSLAISRSDRVRMAISRHLTVGQDDGASISGMDLKALGISPGPVYGEILRAVMLEKLDGRLRNRDSQLEWVRRRYLEG